MNLPNKDKIVLKKLKKFQSDEGEVLHALKDSEDEFNGFKESYLSTIKNNKIKSWKRHLKMKMNLIVPVGEVQFNFYDFEEKLIDNIIIGNGNLC